MFKWIHLYEIKSSGILDAVRCERVPRWACPQLSYVGACRLRHRKRNHTTHPRVNGNSLRVIAAKLESSYSLMHGRITYRELRLGRIAWSNADKQVSQLKVRGGMTVVINRDRSPSIHAVSALFWAPPSREDAMSCIHQKWHEVGHGPYAIPPGVLSYAFDS